MALKYLDLEDVDIENREVIKRNIKNIISTPKGTIPGKPNKGSEIRKYLFSDLDDLDIADLEDYVNILIASNEPRVYRVITKATFAAEYNRLTIKVNYVIREIEEVDFASLSLVV